VDSLHLFVSAPLTGSGAGTFIATYPAWQTAITRGLVVDHAHNDYLEMLTDLGLIGFGLVCWFWLAFLKSVIPAWRQRRTRAARLISAGAFAGLCSILLHSLTDFNLAIPANGLYFFMLLALFAAASHASTQRHRGRTLLLPASDSFRKGSLLVGVLLLLLGGFYLGSGEWAVYRFASLNALDMNRATPTQLKEVVEISAALSRIAPLNPVYPFAAGMVVGLQGDVDLSLQQYKRAIWQRPFHVEYLQQVARTLFASRDKTSAETLLKNALKINPWNWTSYAELAKYYFASGRSSAGFEILKRELQLNPAQTSSVLSLLVVNGIKRTDFFYVMPARSRCWAVLGDFYLQLDDTKAADRAYRRGVESTGTGESPDAYIFWRYLQMLRQEKRNPEALALLRTALNLFPGNASFLATQGTLYEREGLPDRAIESYRAAMLADPERAWVRKRLHSLMAKRGR
ncbi:MAG: tetratricopeptide repeat protein, partial [Geopsychrobacter sp.]|nr:tetratricopeptide repeat protein [Geopsychrobacter sp.]